MLRSMQPRTTGAGPSLRRRTTAQNGADFGASLRAVSGASLTGHGVLRCIPVCFDHLPGLGDGLGPCSRVRGENLRASESEGTRLTNKHDRRNRVGRQIPPPRRAGTLTREMVRKRPRYRAMTAGLVERAIVVKRHGVRCRVSSTGASTLHATFGRRARLRVLRKSASFELAGIPGHATPPCVFCRGHGGRLRHNLHAHE